MSKSSRRRSFIVPADWLQRKIATYKRFAIEPYLDHTFFMLAHRQGAVEKAIRAARELGFRVIEFMNTTDEISAKQWKAWRKLATELRMKIIFEHHPIWHWDQTLPACPTSAEQILRQAEPFLEDGAFIVMIDHEEFDLQGERAGERNRQSCRRPGLGEAGI